MQVAAYSKEGQFRFRQGWDSGSQSQPATSASGLQNAPAAFGFHTSAEAVIADALDAARLECSFHLESIY